MNYYKLNHHEYVKLIRRCASLADFYNCEDLTELLLNLAHVKFDERNLYFEVSEVLMQQIAIASMCEMSMVQYNDSNGEIDYAELGDNSFLVLNSIIRNILSFGCETR